MSSVAEVTKIMRQTSAIRDTRRELHSLIDRMDRSDLERAIRHANEDLECAMLDGNALEAGIAARVAATAGEELLSRPDPDADSPRDAAGYARADYDFKLARESR